MKTRDPRVETAPHWAQDLARQHHEAQASAEARAQDAAEDERAAAALFEREGSAWWGELVLAIGKICAEYNAVEGVVRLDLESSGPLIVRARRGGDIVASAVFSLEIRDEGPPLLYVLTQTRRGREHHRLGIIEEGLMPAAQLARAALEPWLVLLGNLER
jgi:hypothetical protein